MSSQLTEKLLVPSLEVQGDAVQGDAVQFDSVSTAAILEPLRFFPRNMLILIFTGDSPQQMS